MKNQSIAIIGLAFGLFSIAAVSAAEPASITSRVNNALQERIEYRMQTRLESWLNNVTAPVDAGRTSQVQSETEMQVEITDCPCDNLPLAG